MGFQKLKQGNVQKVPNYLCTCEHCGSSILVSVVWLQENNGGNKTIVKCDESFCNGKMRIAKLNNPYNERNWIGDFYQDLVLEKWVAPNLQVSEDLKKPQVDYTKSPVAEKSKGLPRMENPVVINNLPLKTVEECESELLEKGSPLPSLSMEDM